MTTLSEVLQTVIRTFTRTDDDVVLTDIHFQPVSETGELFVFDDEDKPIAHAVVESWADLDDEAFLPTVRVDLEKAIAAANADGALERLAVWKPYSFVLVDEDRETICDLFLVSDDTLVLTDQLLSDLDTDLDAFFENLMDEL
ncbi:MAG: hypothetical protein IKH59_00510 [Bacteroidaceae bacterium]|jgi:hypothetical protein|nr:hypothetical protein [Bacteroidaceae bacterium]